MWLTVCSGQTTSRFLYLETPLIFSTNRSTLLLIFPPLGSSSVAQSNVPHTRPSSAIHLATPALSKVLLHLHRSFLRFPFLLASAPRAIVLLSTACLHHVLLAAIVPVLPKHVL